MGSQARSDAYEPSWGPSRKCLERFVALREGLEEGLAEKLGKASPLTIMHAEFSSEASGDDISSSLDSRSDDQKLTDAARSCLEPTGCRRSGRRRWAREASSQGA